MEEYYQIEEIAEIAEIEGNNDTDIVQQSEFSDCEVTIQPLSLESNTTEGITSAHRHRSNNSFVLILIFILLIISSKD